MVAVNDMVSAKGMTDGLRLDRCAGFDIRIILKGRGSNSWSKSGAS